MPRSTRVVTGLAAAALALSLAACSSSGGGSDATTAAGTTAASSPAETTSASTVDTSSPGADTDYSSLLVAASDIPVPGFEMGTPATPPQGTGTTVAYTGEGGRTLGDTILVLGSDAEAQAAAASAVTAATTSVEGAEVTEAPIGDGGTAIRGTSGANAVAVVIFSQGTAFVVLEFDSPAADPVPTDVVQAVATAQSAKITSGLPR